jgi:hypothetical protein
VWQPKTRLGASPSFLAERELPPVCLRPCCYDRGTPRCYYKNNLDPMCRYYRAGFDAPGIGPLQIVPKLACIQLQGSITAHGTWPKSCHRLLLVPDLFGFQHSAWEQTPSGNENQTRQLSGPNCQGVGALLLNGARIVRITHRVCCLITQDDYAAEEEPVERFHRTSTASVRTILSKTEDTAGFLCRTAVQSAYCTAASHDIYGIHLAPMESKDATNGHAMGQLCCLPQGARLHAARAYVRTPVGSCLCLVVLRLPAEACSVCAPSPLRWTILCLCVA